MNETEMTIGAYLSTLGKDRYEEHACLAQHCTFRIGGTARFLLLPRTAEELIGDIEACRKSGTRYTVIGNGSNLLFSDDGFDGAVIVTAGLDGIRQDKNEITADAGASLTRLAAAAQSASLGGLAFAYGIPGTVGGAVFMNAGAYGGEVSSVLRCVTAYDAEHEKILTVPASDCAFGYRHSLFQEQPLIVLSATFSLTFEDPDAIRAEMDEYMTRRREKQPLEFPSAGSVFKRCEGRFTGQMIEQAGLKGTRIGGAEVSEKHAGFIINRGGATARDVLDLIALIQKTLLEKEGIAPECEIRVIE